MRWRIGRPIQPRSTPTVPLCLHGVPIEPGRVCVLCRGQVVLPLELSELDRADRDGWVARPEPRPERVDLRSDEDGAVPCDGAR